MKPVTLRSAQEARALARVIASMREPFFGHVLPVIDGLLMLPIGLFEARASVNRRKAGFSLPGNTFYETAWIASYRAATLLSPPFDPKPFARTLIKRAEEKLGPRLFALAHAEIPFAKDGPDSLFILDMDALETLTAAGWLAGES